MPSKVEHTTREVIERKLLVALEDVDTVAVLARKEDLDLFIWALEEFKCQGFPRFEERAKHFASDLRQLRRAAFGQE